MSRPRFSVVVPTRGRPETLAFALRSCLEQQFDDLEIVVCDNCSDSRTREVALSSLSPKIRYVRSDTPLSMSHNWELALSHARGEFITFLGDDDGLLVHGLREADEAIRALNAKILYADQIYYGWPGLVGGWIRENGAIFPPMGRTVVMPSRTVLDTVMNCLSSAGILPSIYNSLVHRDVVDRVRSASGRVFNGRIPDLYSGFAITASVNRYAKLEVPMRIAGISARSTGQAYARSATDDISKEFDRLSEAAGPTWNPKVPRIPKSYSALAADCVQQVKDHLEVGDATLPVDRRALVQAIVTELHSTLHPLSLDEWRRSLDELTRCVAGAEHLSRWFEATFGNLDRDSPPPWASGEPAPFGTSASGIYLDVSRFGVSDVCGVAELFENIYQRKHRKPDISFASPVREQWVAATKELLREMSPRPVLNALRKVRRRWARSAVPLHVR